MVFERHCFQKVMVSEVHCFIRGKLAGREPRAFPDEFIAQIRLVYSKKSTLIILINEGSSRLAHWPSQLSTYIVFDKEWW